MSDSGSLREIVPVWKPTPNRFVQRYNLPDNGSMGFTMNEPLSGAEDITVLPVKQSKPTRFEPMYYSALPFMPPNSDVCSLEDAVVQEQKARPIESYHLQAILTSHMTRFSRNPTLVKELKKILRQLKSNRDVELDIPSYVLNIMKVMPDDLADSRVRIDDLLYNGGGLHYLADVPAGSPRNAFLYTSGKKLNKLVYVPLEFNQNLPTPCLIPKLNDSTSRMFSKKIHQITSCEMDGRIVYGVRMQHKMEFGRIDASDDGAVSLDHLSKINLSTFVMDLSLSSYIPECLYVLDDGSIRIADLTTGDNIFEYNKYVDNIIKKRQWSSCQFGNHPRCFVYTSRQKCALTDVRATCRHTLKLLQSPSNAVVHGEKFACYEKSKASSNLHYIASSHSLFLVDQRYPMHPVISWKHQSVALPNYCSSALWCSNGDCTNEEAVILTAKQSQESVAFHVRHVNNGRQLSVSMAPPLHLCPPRDLAHGLRDADRTLDIATPLKTDLQLHGFGCLALEHKQLVAMYLTSDGNIYHQRFQYAGENDWQAGENWRPAMTEDHVKSAEDWLDSAIDKMRAKPPEVSANQKEVDLTSLYTAITNSEMHNHKCLSCCECEDGVENKNGGRDDDLCGNCNLPVTYTEDLHEKIKMSQIIAGPNPKLEDVPSNDENNADLFTLKEPNPADGEFDVLKSIMDVWWDDISESSETAAETSFPNVSLSQHSKTPPASLSHYSQNPPVDVSQQPSSRSGLSDSRSCGSDSRRMLSNYSGVQSQRGNSQRLQTHSKVDKMASLLDTYFESLPESVSCRTPGEEQAAGAAGYEPDSSVLSQSGSQHADFYMSQGFLPAIYSEDDMFMFGATPQLAMHHDHENVVPPSQVVTPPSVIRGSVKKLVSKSTPGRRKSTAMDGF